jgi:hypothetical protein
LPGATTNGQSYFAKGSPRYGATTNGQSDFTKGSPKLGATTNGQSDFTLGRLSPALDGLTLLVFKIKPLNIFLISSFYCTASSFSSLHFLVCIGRWFFICFLHIEKKKNIYVNALIYFILVNCLSKYSIVSHNA